MASANDYVATERLYLDDKGQIVGDKDPNKLTLVAAPGHRIPREQALRWGLVEPKAPAPAAVDEPKVQPRAAAKKEVKTTAPPPPLVPAIKETEAKPTNVVKTMNTLNFGKGSDAKNEQSGPGGSTP